MSAGGEESAMALLAPSPPTREELEDLIGALWLYLGRYAETQLTTEQKELYYDVIDRHLASGRSPNDPPYTPLERWWELAE